MKVKITGTFDPDKLISRIKENKKKFLNDVAKYSVQAIRDEIDNVQTDDKALKARVKEEITSSVEGDSVNISTNKYLPFREESIEGIKGSHTYSQLASKNEKYVKVSDIKGELFKWAPKDSFAKMQGNKYYLSHYIGNFFTRAIAKTKNYIAKNAGKIIEGK